MLLETLDIMNYCSVEELGQLREEIQNLGVTINQLEHHSDRMKIWWESIGKAILFLMILSYQFPKEI